MADIPDLSQLYIGTSGWSYKHWSEVFYPVELKSIKYLEYYTTHFECVELNASFYYPPQEATVKGWMDRTPDHFIFCPKMSRYITHLRRLKDTGGSMESFFKIFEGLKSKLGPFLVQLPPGFKYDMTLAKDFFTGLTEHYGDLRFAVEVRHKSWISDNFFSLLEQFGIAFVIADSGSRFPYYEAITADFLYMRFHGHEKLYASDYPEWELKEYAAKIASWLEKEKAVYAFFNNDYGGYAVKNAKKLKELIGKSGID